jgi:hypothetical protein
MALAMLGDVLEAVSGIKGTFFPDRVFQLNCAAIIISI